MRQHAPNRGGQERTSAETPRRVQQPPDMLQVLGNRQLQGNMGASMAAGAGGAAPAREDPAHRDGTWLTEAEKPSFLSAIRAAVYQTADEGLAGTGQTARGCPYIERWLAYYEQRSAAQVEMAVHRYAPETRFLQNAAEMVPVVAARARRAVDQWALNGEISGLPDDIPAGLNLMPRSGAEPGGEANPAAVQARLGEGAPFGGEQRSRMERALGRPLGDVRLHTGADAASLAGGLDARAFTVGRHVAFGAGEFRPGTIEGDALLAHELAHVEQQRRSEPETEDRLERGANRSAVGTVLALWTGVPRIPSAPARGGGLRLQRCSGPRPPERYTWQIPELKRTVDGTSSPSVVYDFVQALPEARQRTALIDLERGRADYVRFLPTVEANDPGAALIMRESITVLDVVLSWLYRDVAQRQRPGHTAPETEFAHGSAPAELTAGTTPLTRDQRSAVHEALSPTPTVDPTTGERVRFRRTIGGVNFEDALRPLIIDGINEQHSRMFASRAPLRANSSNLHTWAHLEQIANAAKGKVDQVFGSYATRPAFTAGVNLLDRWERIEGEIPGYDDAEKMGIARWRVEKIIKEYDTVRGVMEQYGYTPGSSGDRPLRLLVNELAAAHRDRLVEIHQGWPAAAPAPGTVEIQRFISQPTGPSAAAQEDANRRNRRFLWRTFQTMIHEYTHTLTHSRYNAYVDGMRDELRAHTLREGMTEVFTRISWNNVNPSEDALRRTVEGSFFDPAAPLDVPEAGYYDAVRDAENVVAIVGIRNAMAAYFLGEIELIGG
ncbi:MAG: DUF4157 domain-containing protein [Bryobacteraceae bacterium]|nr:DUF4157 domain-containing protein [Bryobacteraceae bacterium]